MKRLQVDGRQSWKPQDVYTDAIAFLANNDEEFSECYRYNCADGLVSVMVIAEIFGLGSDEVAADVAEYIAQAAESAAIVDGAS